MCYDNQEPQRSRLMHRTVAILFLLASTIGASAAEPIGEWLVANGAARIKIDKCGDGYWGVVAWEIKPGQDLSNPDPSKRDRPTLGLPILLNMQPKGERWEGEVYNAENGKTYSSNISLTGPDSLQIAGCVLGFLCGGETWTRFKRPAERTTGMSPERARADAGTRSPERSKVDAGIDVCSSVARATGTPHERRLK